MRKLRDMALIGALVLAPSAHAEPPCGKTLTLTPLTQRGPTCAVAATVMAANAQGAGLALDQITRAIPVWQDGVSFFDLADALSVRGFASLTFQGDAALAARFVDAGVPVVAALDLHGGKHAVTLDGYDGERARATCTPTRVRGIDPWLGRPFTLERVSFERAQFARQLFVLWPRASDAPAKLAAAGVDLAPLIAANHRFRAEELVMRARLHKAPNAQMVILLERAVAEDPSYEVATTLLAATRRALAPP